MKIFGGYKIDFSRIDNPVEALMIPPVDFSLLSSKKNLDSVKQGTVSVGKDRFDYTIYKDEFSYTYRGKTNRCALENPGEGAGILQGRLGESEIRLKMEPGREGMKISGKAGEMEVREICRRNPSAIIEGGAFMTHEGKIGNLDYKEEFFLARDQQGKSALLSRGRLGKMEISRAVTFDEKGNDHVEGHIGDYKISQAIIYEPKTPKKS